jgi:hypothetical protein
MATMSRHLRFRTSPGRSLGAKAPLRRVGLSPESTGTPGRRMSSGGIHARSLRRNRLDAERLFRAPESAGARKGDRRRGRVLRPIRAMCRCRPARVPDSLIAQPRKPEAGAPSNRLGEAPAGGLGPQRLCCCPPRASVGGGPGRRREATLPLVRDQRDSPKPSPPLGRAAGRSTFRASEPAGRRLSPPICTSPPPGTALSLLGKASPSSGGTFPTNGYAPPPNRYAPPPNRYAPPPQQVQASPHWYRPVPTRGDVHPQRVRASPQRVRGRTCSGEGHTCSGERSPHSLEPSPRSGEPHPRWEERRTGWGEACTRSGERSLRADGTSPCWKEALPGRLGRPKSSGGLRRRTGESSTGQGASQPHTDEGAPGPPDASGLPRRALRGKGGQPLAPTKCLGPPGRGQAPPLR